MLAAVLNQLTTDVKVIGLADTIVKKPPVMMPPTLPQTTRRLLIATGGVAVDVGKVTVALPTVTAPPKMAVAPEFAVTVAVVPATVPVSVTDLTVYPEPEGRVMLIVAVPPWVSVSVNDTIIAGEAFAAMKHL